MKHLLRLLSIFTIISSSTLSITACNNKNKVHTTDEYNQLEDSKLQVYSEIKEFVNDRFLTNEVDGETNNHYVIKLNNLKGFNNLSQVKAAIQTKGENHDSLKTHILQYIDELKTKNISNELISNFTSFFSNNQDKNIIEILSDSAAISMTKDAIESSKVSNILNIIETDDNFKNLQKMLIDLELPTVRDLFTNSVVKTDFSFEVLIKLDEDVVKANVDINILLIDYQKEKQLASITKILNEYLNILIEQNKENLFTYNSKHSFLNVKAFNEDAINDKVINSMLQENTKNLFINNNLGLEIKKTLYRVGKTKKLNFNDFNFINHKDDRSRGPYWGETHWFMDYFKIVADKVNNVNEKSFNYLYETFKEQQEKKLFNLYEYDSENNTIEIGNIEKLSLSNITLFGIPMRQILLRDLNLKVSLNQYWEDMKFLLKSFDNYQIWLNPSGIVKTTWNSEYFVGFEYKPVLEPELASQWNGTTKTTKSFPGEFYGNVMKEQGKLDKDISVYYHKDVPIHVKGNELKDGGVLLKMSYKGITVSIGLGVAFYYIQTN